MPNNFYQVSNLQQEAGRLTCSIAYNAAHPVLEGHFPGQPVVPGVCTMDMIKDLLQGAVGQKLLLRSAGQVKFLQLILPSVQPQVELTWQPAAQGYSITASLKAGDAFLFKMNGVFEAV